jgi:hypothetical protein
MRNRIVATTDFDIDLIGKVWSAGTLNIAKAISIFHDIVDVQRGDNEERSKKETHYGDLVPEKGRTANEQLALFCSLPAEQEWLKKRKVVKLTRYVDREGVHRLRYFVDNPYSADYMLNLKTCVLNPREPHLQFKIKRPGQPERTEIFSIADVAEVVPRVR